MPVPYGFPPSVVQRQYPLSLPVYLSVYQLHCNFSSSCLFGVFYSNVEQLYVEAVGRKWGVL